MRMIEEMGRYVVTGTAMCKPSGLLYIPSFSYVLMLLKIQKRYTYEETRAKNMSFPREVHTPVRRTRTQTHTRKDGQDAMV